MKKFNFLPKTRWLVTIIVLFTLCINQVWAETSNYSVTASSGALSGWSGTVGSAYNDGSVKFGTQGNNLSKTDIWSGTVSTNMTSISVTINYKINGTSSSSNVFTVAAVNSSGTVKASATFAPTSTSYTDANVSLTIPASSAVTGLKITYTTKSSGNVGLKSLSATATYTAASTSVSASPTSITFDADELDGNGEASGSTTLDVSVTNGYKSGGNYLFLTVLSDDTECEFTVNSGAYSYSSGNSTSIDDLSVEYYAIDAGTWTGKIIASGYNSSYTAVNCTIPLSVTISSACANSITIATGSPTNCSISTNSTSLATCSSTAADRQVTVSVAPSSCYAAPVKASVTYSGTATPSWVSGPTWNSSTSKYDYVFQWAQDATGSTTFNCSLSTKTTYTVTYAAGSTTHTSGNSITGSHANDSKTCGTNMNLPGETFSTTGYTQDGWATSDGGAKAYNLSATNYAIDAAQTLYPHWDPNKYTVSWSVNGTVTSTTANVSYGTTTSTPANPSAPSACSSSKFMGWTATENYSGDSAPGNLFNSTTPTITGNITFHAVFADYDD